MYSEIRAIGRREVQGPHAQFLIASSWMSWHPQTLSETLAIVETPEMEDKFTAPDEQSVDKCTTSPAE